MCSELLWGESLRNGDPHRNVDPPHGETASDASRIQLVRKILWKTARSFTCSGRNTAHEKQCKQLAPRLLRAIYQLREAGLPQLVTLGDTLASWAAEIAAMWRFTRNNGITEGFHTKMELISRQAYGFRNFENYRLRVKVPVLCSS